jgi:hypothetical protein
MVDLFTSCNITIVWKSFVCSSLLYLSEKYPMLFIPRSQLFKNFFNSRITCKPCSSLQNTKKIIFVTLEFLLGTNLLVENMLHYTSIMNWSDAKPLYKLQDRRNIERILHKSTFLYEFVKDNHYSIPGADNCSQAKETLWLCENIIWETLQPNTFIFKILRFSMHISTYF